MHRLYELLVPSKAEAVFYLFMSGALLLLINGSALWQELLTSTQTDVATAETIGLGLKDFVSTYTTLSDPQVVSAVVWGLTGGLGLLIALAVIGFVRETEDDSQELRNDRLGFFEKVGVRILALLALVVLVFITIGVVIPFSSRIFVRTTLHILTPYYAVLQLAFVIVLTAFCLYLAAILCRLVVLRLRVFSSVID